MKTYCDSARMLALAALLALTGAGGARSAGCAPQTTPMLTVNAQQYSFDIFYAKSFGEDIVLLCSSNNATHLEMKEYSESLQIIKVNTTTIRFRVKKPLGRYSYSCVDVETGCEDSLTIEVRPVMFVESLRVRHKVKSDLHHYFVPVGEDYEVLCSGHDSRALKFKDRKLQVEVVNRTLIKYRTQADRVEEKFYTCLSIVTVNGVEDLVHTGISVTLDYYPECHNFWCVIYDMSVLECIWYYSRDQILYKLFYSDLTDGYEYTTLLCSDGARNANGACTVNQRFKERDLLYRNHNLSLLLMSCNEWICNNQSFAINVDAIAKAGPVADFAVLNTSSHGVAMEFLDFNRYVNYKVEYRQTLEDSWRQADLSSMRCVTDWRCAFTLTLPFPETEYEVRVYARNKKATDDRLWSEPKSLVVTTTPRMEECKCSDAAAELAPTISVEEASCQICTLTEYRINEGLALKKKISALKKKLDDIKKISALLPGSNEMKKILNNYG